MSSWHKFNVKLRTCKLGSIRGDFENSLFSCLGQVSLVVSYGHYSIQHPKIYPNSKASIVFNRGKTGENTRSKAHV